jgi:hypothetical protein
MLIDCAAGYTLQNDCSIAVATSLPFTLLGDVWDDGASLTRGAVLVFVFPFERHIHDFGHVQYMLKSLLDMMEAPYSQSRIAFQSYTSVFLFSSSTDRIRAISRHMARDAEVALLTSSAPWLHKFNSPRLACSTMQRVETNGRSCQAAYAGDVCADAAQVDETKEMAGNVSRDGLCASCTPIHMVVVAVGAAGEDDDCKRNGTRA